jgi:hypothetical protein
MEHKISLEQKRKFREQINGKVFNVGKADENNNTKQQQFSLPLKAETQGLLQPDQANHELFLR